MKQYQLIIVGGGPAGLMAATYAARNQIKTLLISDHLGGMISLAHKIQNFPGEKEITGTNLAQKMIEQAQFWKAEMIPSRVTKIEEKENFIVQTEQNKSYQSPFLLLALGTHKKKMNLPHEDEFIGKGLSYCALCDGHFFKDKDVAVCGSGDAAATTAVYLSQIAKTVYLIARRDDLKCNLSWKETVKKSNNIILLCNNEIIGLTGKEKLDGLKLKNPYQRKNELPLDGLFVEIGVMPSSLLAKDLNLALDKENFILINNQGQTSRKNIWAAGDITTGSNKLWQAVTACAEGAIAAESIYCHVKQGTKADWPQFDNL